MLSDFERIKYLNQMFSTNYLNIEECRIHNSLSEKYENRMVKDVEEVRIEAVKKSLQIPDVPGSVVPFR
jgi:hypothetical protein